MDTPRVVFFQGIGARFNQIERTLGSLFKIENIVCPKKDLDEIIPWGSTWNPLYLIMMLYIWIRGKWRGAPCAPYAIRPSTVNIGQMDDIDALKEREKQLEKNEKYIAFGISRGALTTRIRHVVTKNEHIPKLVLLEGCPDSIPNVMEYRYGKTGQKIIEKLLSWFTQYDPLEARQISPINLIKQWPRNIPIAFVTSEKDTSVPMTGTIQLVNKLREHGMDVHLLVLKDAHHDNYLTSSDRDRKDYIEFVKKLTLKYC